MPTTRLLPALATLLVVLHARADKAPPAPPYAPPPPEAVTGYSSSVFPCKIERDGRTTVTCKDQLLESRTLRELAILRNTIYARYGWDGFRKPWLRDHFRAQPWFRPNPAFSYKLVSDVDKKNAHFIAAYEQSLTSFGLERRAWEVQARHGKTWSDAPKWKVKGGRVVQSCRRPAGAVEPAADDYDGETISAQCQMESVPWYKPDPAYSDARLTAEDRIELGLISRAMGGFGVDGQAVEAAGAESLARLLKVDELRQLSLRDLRLLRNTIYARHGRRFKSAILQEHFDGMSWYQQNPDYADKLLTRNEERNVALIRSVENEFGGPLTDDDWLTEPATDGA